MTTTDRAPGGLWQKGQSGSPDTMFKTGDPANPRTQAKRARAARGRRESQARELEREAMRGELVALDVLERFLSRSKRASAPRLPRLPGGPNAQREMERIASRSALRSLRALQRIARDPKEPESVRVEVARMLLERNGRRTEPEGDEAYKQALAEAKATNAAGGAFQFFIPKYNLPVNPRKLASQLEHLIEQAKEAGWLKDWNKSGERKSGET